MIKLDCPFLQPKLEEGEYRRPLTRAEVYDLHDEVFKANPQALIIDLRTNVDIYDWWIRRDRYWQPDTVVYNTKGILRCVAAVHAEWPEETTRYLLENLCASMRDISLGSRMFEEDYQEAIQEALDLRFCMEVEPNESMRYLTNPYFEWPADTTRGDKDKITKAFRNKCIGRGRRDKVYKTIKAAMKEIEGKKTTAAISRLTNLHRNTIHKYLKKHPELSVY